MSAGERERLQDVQRRVRSGNQSEVRALAKAWAVPQKAAGKNRSVPELRRELEEKIATALAEPAADQGHDGVARKVARTDPGNALEFLDGAEVRKASAYLETLPADARVDELRNLLELWRAVREQTTFRGQRNYLRQVARSSKIIVPKKDVSSPYLVSGKISEAFVERVSALRHWEAVRNRGSSSSASAAPVFPEPPRGGDSDAAELAGGGEGEATSSGQTERATGNAQPLAVVSGPRPNQRRAAQRRLRNGKFM